MKCRNGAGAIVCAAIAVAVATAWVRSYSTVDTLGWQHVWKDPLRPEASVSHEFGLVSIRGQLRLVWQVTRHDEGVALYMPDALNGNGLGAATLSRYCDDYDIQGEGDDPPGMNPVNLWSDRTKFGLRAHADLISTNQIGYRGWQVGTPHWLWFAVAGMATVVFGRRWWTARRAVMAGRCRRCGYDLRASPSRCPECGTFNKAADVIGGAIEDRG